jgi:hypothetical protein
MRKTACVRRAEIEALKPLRKRLRKDAHSLNSYAIVGQGWFSQKEEVFEWRNRVCYASLEKNRWPFLLEYFLDWPFAQCLNGREEEPGPYRKFDKVEKQWLKWLVSKSAWKGAFRTRNVSEMQRLGIVYNTTPLGPFVVQAAMLARYLSEDRRIVATWSKLLPLMDPHIAVHLAHSIKVFDGFHFGFERDCSSNPNHQAWIHSQVGRRGLIRMIEGKPIRVRHTGYKSFKHSTRYRGMNTIWGAKINENDSWRAGPATKDTLSFPEGQEFSYTVFGDRRTFSGFKLEDWDQVMKRVLKLNDLSDYGGNSG